VPPSPEPVPAVDAVPRPAVDAPVFAGEMCSYALDVWVDPADVLSDPARLVAVMRVSAEAGHAEVLDESVHVFPNGAVTAVLLLSQSHLSVHTWPELGMANFDLLTCGRLNGELILARLRDELTPVRANVTRVIRDVY
jgi:S-adenosylmethionine decarboxylase